MDIASHVDVAHLGGHDLDAMEGAGFFQLVVTESIEKNLPPEFVGRDEEKRIIQIFVPGKEAPLGELLARVHPVGLKALGGTSGNLTGQAPSTDRLGAAITSLNLGMYHIDVDGSPDLKQRGSYAIHRIVGGERSVIRPKK